MTREQLEHAIRAACDVAEDTEVVVFGSQAILGEHPCPPDDVTASMEVDIQPRNKPDRFEDIDGALGEFSEFHTLHGFYVHGVSLESAILPPGWEGRTIAVPGRGSRAATGLCLESHDLAASKLAAGREKDREFVASLIVNRLIGTDALIERVGALPLDEDHIRALLSWIEGFA